jgi:hypothetical protein
MKRVFALTIALLSFGTAAALADNGGISGSVVDVTTGRTLANVPITITRVESTPRTWTTKTNSKGQFSDITLEPGRYIVVATFPGMTIGCAVDDVYGGQTVQMKIGVGRPNIMCTGPRVHPALIDPSATADVYRIQ